jgi:RimJ/RimL family protein N-acetyltransferase
LKSFIREIARRIYAKVHFIRLELNIDRALPKISSSIDFYLEPASPSDIQNLLQIARDLSRSSAYDLVARKFFYDSGFHDCYVGKTKAAKDPCYLGWLLSVKKNPALQDGFKGIPPLKEDEVLLYNLFVFDKYRGKGVASSADAQLCEIARQNGFKRAVVYPLKSNPAAIKSLKKIGFTEKGTKTHLYFAFFVKTTSQICPKTDLKTD